MATKELQAELVDGKSANAKNSDHCFLSLFFPPERSLSGYLQEIVAPRPPAQRYPPDVSRSEFLSTHAGWTGNSRTYTARYVNAGSQKGDSIKKVLLIVLAVAFAAAAPRPASLPPTPDSPVEASPTVRRRCRARPAPRSPSRGTGPGSRRGTSRHRVRASQRASVDDRIGRSRRRHRWRRDPRDACANPYVHSLLFRARPNPKPGGGPQARSRLGLGPPACLSSAARLGAC